MIEIAPTTLEDCERMLGSRPLTRIRAMSARVDGELVAIGGLTYLRDGTVVAFLEGHDAVKRWPITIHKAVRRGLDDAKRRGVRRIVAVAADDVEAAPRWLERLGFQSGGVPGVYLWEQL